MRGEGNHKIPGSFAPENMKKTGAERVKYSLACQYEDAIPIKFVSYAQKCSTVLCTFAVALRKESVDRNQGMVLSTRQSSYPLQTYIQQMVVTLDYSTMNVDQIAQAMKLNNLSLDSAKIFIAMIPVLIVYPFLQRYFVEGITLGSVKG